MIICSTSHHLLVKTIIVYDAPNVSPNIMNHLFIGCIHTLMIRVMLDVTKFNKIYKLS